MTRANVVNLWISGARILSSSTMEISPTRVESPLPFIDFDDIWRDAVKRYYIETAHVLPDVYENCTATNPTLDLIHKRHPEFPLKFAIPRENGRLFRELLTELLELLRQYAKLVWADEGEVGARRFQVLCSDRSL